MLTATEPLPTEDEIINLVRDDRYYLGMGAYRTVYRKSESHWVIKIDYENGKINQREYDNYVRLSPSLSNPSVRLPEMHMVGRYLVAEYIDGEKGNFDCWSRDNAIEENGKAHYTNGCANSECAEGDNCWANLTKEFSAHVADIHYANVRVTTDKVVYIIDLGEH